MHQTAKGKQWYYGMKAHRGADSQTKVIHSVTATAANVADPTVLPSLLHGRETWVYGGQAYRGRTAMIRQCAPRAQDFTHRRFRHGGQVDEVERGKNRTNAKVRAKADHAIGVITRIFGFTKVRDRGLAKNTHRLLVTCALTNLFLVRRRLLPTGGEAVERVDSTGEPVTGSPDWRRLPDPSGIQDSRVTADGDAASEMDIIQRFLRWKSPVSLSPRF